MALTYDPIFAVDPANPANVAKNASITIFDPADVAQAPIAIQDPTGSPLPNPMTLDAAGMGPAFQHPTLARVGWKGAGFVGYFTSYEGMYNETVAAKEAAQAAESAASTAGSNAAAVASEALAGAVSDAEAAATAAANAASLVGAPADTAIAAAVSGNGATKAALNATYATSTVPAYVTGSHVKGYESRLGVYNLKPKHLRKTRARLAAAKAGTGRANISWCGTSLVAGEGAAPYKDNSPPVRLRAGLAALGYPAGGTGLVLDRNGASGNDGRISASGAWSIQGASGIVSASTEDGAWKQFTSDLTGTVAEVEYRDTGTGQVKVTVDGVDVETFAGTNTGNLLVKTYTGLADTVHTVRFTKVGTTAGPQIAGYGVRKASGVTVSSVGVGGSKASDWAFMNATAPGYIARGYGADLYILDVMTNDAINAVPVETYKTNMQAVITYLLGTGSPEMILVADIPRGAGNDAAYRTALYDLADSNDLPLIDLYERWGTAEIAFSLGMMQTDRIHATAIGYADKGTALIPILAGI